MAENIMLSSGVQSSLTPFVTRNGSNFSPTPVVAYHCLSLQAYHPGIAAPLLLSFWTMFTKWAPPSEFVSSSIPSWQTLTAHAQPFRGARDLAFCLKVPLDSLLLWASSEGSGETARMRRLAWTFAARIGDKYQIRLARPKWFRQKSYDSYDSGFRLNIWIDADDVTDNLLDWFVFYRIWAVLKNGIKVWHLGWKLKIIFGSHFWP